MLRLWCRRPYRQRNMREMLLGENLYRNGDGQWMIRFHGAQLKVGKRRGNENEFLLPFPDELTSMLEAYLEKYRPVLFLKGRSKHQLVFLNTRGNPYTWCAWTILHSPEY